MSKVMNPAKAWNGFWYFWDETWAHQIGPFETEEKARQGMQLYGESLEIEHRPNFQQLKENER